MDRGGLPAHSIPPPPPYKQPPGSKQIKRQLPQQQQQPQHQYHGRRRQSAPVDEHHHDDLDSDQHPPLTRTRSKPRGSFARDPSAASTAFSQESTSFISSSFLEPRVARILQVPNFWQRALFFSRLLSIGPGIFWGHQPALQLLLRALLSLPLASMLDHGHGTSLNGMAAAAGCSADGEGNMVGGLPGTSSPVVNLGSPYPWTEQALGVMWCGVSAYLSFFFADCLMSRWIIHYTPPAATIRVLTINCANFFLTERILHLVGGFEDARLLLPGWISIATTLTICYHITQRKINIEKETSTSINIFSIASFLSMVLLLAHIHSDRTDYPVPPIYRLAMDAQQWWQRVAAGEDSLGMEEPAAAQHCEL